MQSFLSLTREKEAWQEFISYKIENQHMSGNEEAAIRRFVEEGGYLKLSNELEKGNFPASLAVRRTVNKEGTKKKRIVYSFEGEEGIFLKFLAWQMYRYDALFSSNCYAFRRSIGVKEAFRRIQSIHDLAEKYCLKVDLNDYFNSIPVEKLLEKLQVIKEEDFVLFHVFERILRQDKVIENGVETKVSHGAMAGIPIAPFLANLYLAETDAFFEKEGVLYFRYSDDILIFADRAEELEERKEQLYTRLEALGLSINPAKESLAQPGGYWEFLGFGYRNGEIDLSDNTLRKTKAKIKRKAEALRRWQRKKGLTPDKAAIGLIHTMNRKFFGCATEEERLEKDFTWCRWFLPILTTDKGLHEIDTYLQEYIRYAVTGRHYKGNYRIRYEDLKRWGYRSLVHAYWKEK